jgi:hypothetical protein
MTAVNHQQQQMKEEENRHQKQEEKKKKSHHQVMRQKENSWPRRPWCMCLCAQSADKRHRCFAAN